MKVTPKTERQLNIAIIELYFVLFKITIIPTFLQQILKVCFVLHVMYFIFTHQKIKDFGNLSILMGLSILFSGLISFCVGVAPVSSLLYGMLHACCIFCLYQLLMFCCYFKQTDRFIYLFLVMTAIYCFFSIIIIGVVGVSKQGASIYYFAGNKFETSYLFVMLACFFNIFSHRINRKSISLKRKVEYLLICALSLIISLWVHCSTAVIASVLLFFAEIIPKRLKSCLCRPGIVVVAILLSAVIILLLEQILRLNFVQFIIVNLLGEDLSLTGRLKIYNSLIKIIQNRPLLGYGYGNQIVIDIVGYGNAQNGLLDWIIQYGIIGAVIFLYLTYECIKKSKRNLTFWSAYWMIYILIICAIVEITFAAYFYMTFLFLLRWSAKDNFEVKLTTSSIRKESSILILNK